MGRKTVPANLLRLLCPVAGLYLMMYMNIQFSVITFTSTSKEVKVHSLPTRINNPTANVHHTAGTVFPATLISHKTNNVSTKSAMTSSWEVPQTKRNHSDAYFVCVKAIERRRLGNHMFWVAAGLGIAAKLNRTLWIPHSSSSVLSNTFEPMSRELAKTKHCPHQLETLHQNDSFYDPDYFLAPRNHSFAIQGYFQSYKYFQHASHTIRAAFTMKKKAIEKAETVLEILKLAFHNVTVVGIHVRRGDYTSSFQISRGAKLPHFSFYVKAMQYFREKHSSNVRFVVCSDDPGYCKERFSQYEDVMIVHQSNAADDLALLAACDHMIVSFGTFGWWAAWLGGGHVVYFDDQYTGKLAYRNQLNRKYLFPPGWVPMGD